MTPAEARDLFSAAHDAELDAAEQAAFSALLARDAALAAEYAEFRATLAAAESGIAAPTEAVDLLPSVQGRLRARSRGRFYGDKFAERTGAGLLNPLTLAIIMIALAVVAWLAFGYLQHVELH